MNALSKQKFNQYEKIKLYIATCFWLFSLTILANGSKNSINKNKVEDEAVKIDIIINKDDIDDYENDNTEDKYKEEGDLIYLDQLPDEEEDEIQKKNEKISKIR